MKQKLLNSLKENHDEEEPGFNEKANGIKDNEKAIKIIKHYHEISKTQNKMVINIFGTRSAVKKIIVFLLPEMFLLLPEFFPRCDNFSAGVRIFLLKIFSSIVGINLSMEIMFSLEDVTNFLLANHAKVLW